MQRVHGQLQAGQVVRVPYQELLKRELIKARRDLKQARGWQRIQMEARIREINHELKELDR